jgi:hypothetical protein
MPKALISPDIPEFVGRRLNLIGTCPQVVGFLSFRR